MTKTISDDQPISISTEDLDALINSIRELRLVTKQLLEEVAAIRSMMSSAYYPGTNAFSVMEKGDW